MIKRGNRLSGSTVHRAELVRKIVDTYYNPQEAKYSLRWVWATKVNPLYPMSLSTFRRLLRLSKRIKQSNE